MPCAPLLTLKELARELRVSRVTLADRIGRAPDFPVVRRGRKGRCWRFERGAVHAYLANQEQAAAEARARREAVLAAHAVPPIEPPSAPAGPTLREQLRAVELRDRLRREAVETGHLVDAAETGARLADLFATLAAGLRELVRQLAREGAWSDPYLDEVLSRLAELQHRIIATVAAGTAGRSGGPADLGDG